MDDPFPRSGAQPAPAPAANRTVDDLVGLLAARDLPRERGGPLAWVWITTIPLLTFGLFMSLTLGQGAFIELLALGLLSARMVSRTTWESCHRRAALLLPELDASWLGTLIEALVSSSASVRAIARLRLTTVLPMLTASDRERLNDAQRVLLFDQLTPYNATVQPDLISAIVRFGAVVGDEAAVAGTERLAKMRAITAAQRRVRTDARRCLPETEGRVADRVARELESVGLSDGSSGRAVGEARVLSPGAQALVDDAENGSKTRPGMRFGYLLALYGVVVPYGLYQTIHQLMVGNWMFAATFAVGTLAVSFAHRLALTPQQAQIAARLASVDDVQAVGPLVEMTTWPDERIQAMALAALTGLLPHLKSSDTHLLSASHRALLYQSLRMVNARRYAEYMVALLQALEQVGDTAAVPYVIELTRVRPLDLRQQRVVEAAQRCLPFLEGCAQQNQDSQVLLRATGPDPDDSLLRPAGKSSVASPDILVRVASATDRE